MVFNNKTVSELFTLPVFLFNNKKVFFYQVLRFDFLKTNPEIQIRCSSE